MNLKTSIYISEEYDVYRNLAKEELLFNTLKDYQIIFYLWQNDNTVVIGKNQSVRSEVAYEKLIKDKGHLARRLSGGGAVYHDLGNLNFTFLINSELFNEERQTSVLIKALSKFFVNAEKNGRNDLLVNNKKINGNAYYHHNGKSYHHGTLLVDTDLSKLEKYLNVSDEKLEKHHVKSVKSRVSNLKDFNKNINIDTLKEELILSFKEEYGFDNEEVFLDEEEIKEKSEFYSSNEWLFQREDSSGKEISARFDWGGITIQFTEDNGYFENVKVWTDCLDIDLKEKLERILKGYKKGEELKIGSPYKEDIGGLLK